MIKTIDGVRHYFDKNGDEIFAGDFVKWPSGAVERIYQAEDGQLGTDATNPVWIADGRAAPCEYGLYPLTKDETDEVELAGSD